MVLGVMWNKTHPFQLASTMSAWTFGKRYVAIGWPITLANAAFGLVETSDRFVLSSAVSIYDFRSQSCRRTMMVPVTLIAAIARVFFSHLRRPKKAASRGLRTGIGLDRDGLECAAPYYFGVDLFVWRFLPKYSGSCRSLEFFCWGLCFLR